jgi:hypothetical protein
MAKKQKQPIGAGYPDKDYTRKLFYLGRIVRVWYVRYGKPYSANMLIIHSTLRGYFQLWGFKVGYDLIAPFRRNETEKW